MIRKLKVFTLQMFAGANIATILVMAAVGYSDHLNPVSFPLLSNAGLAFPVFLLINLVFLIFWLVVKMRWAWLPLAGFLVCYSPMRRYWPVNVAQEPPGGAIKVLSYNVWYFAGWEDKPGQENPILDYIRRQDADIVCLQEASAGEVGQAKIDSVLNPIYQYRDTAHRNSGDCIRIFSKYPIVSKEHIDYDSRGNLSAAFKVMIDMREVLVVNNHLESTGLSPDDKVKFRTMMKGELQADTAEEASRLLVRKLAKATATRAPQADAVARYVAYHRNMPVIVCGDFNDGPISYARRTVGRDLTDCYVETANGPGISYHQNGFFVRIDHIFCSADFEPYACRVDNTIKTSDHYPIVCWLKMRGKTAKNE